MTPATKMDTLEQMQHEDALAHSFIQQIFIEYQCARYCVPKVTKQISFLPGGAYDLVIK